jgi:5-methylcytosine-specific restriction endonuclease McrA
MREKLPGTRYSRYHAVYKIAHRGSLQDYMRAWSAAHPESGRTTTRAYRARKTGVETEPYTLAEIYERDRGICQLCYKRVPTKTKGRSSQRASIDHIIPLSKGGNNLKANVQLAHDHCNQRKSNRDAVASQLRLVG